ncbi:hypothetical protein ALP78_02714 [Pseudomonas coronafaciens pv. striafaciens]|nr:hypothetical protein ALP78_02714 [Pseudomonas coronafaciens pv. striafaciens]
MSLCATAVGRPDLRSVDIDRMFEIYSACYQDTCRARFEQDLDDKTHCVVLRDTHDTIMGFTTLKLFEMSWDNQPCKFIFSGDTIITPEHWGSQQLAFAWSRLVGDLWRQAPDVPLYWFLICKGHRTYRYLRAMVLDYAPRAGHSTAPRVQALMDHLAYTRFGDAYDPATGVLSFKTPQGRLSAELALISENHAKLPEVEYFLQKNPGYAEGDELVCLCRLAPKNLRPLARRLFMTEQYSAC